MSTYFIIVLFIAFSASGLQYSVLGSVWPIMYQDFGVALSAVGYVNTMTAIGRIVASTITDRMVRRFGTYRVALCGFSLICLSLFGYAACRSYIMLLLLSIPLGFGEDFFLCAINAFSAIHLKARHANWLNMVWSLGATLGPFIMSLCLVGGGWNLGYLVLSLMQAVVLALFMFSRRGFSRFPDSAERPSWGKTDSRSAIRLKGMPIMMAAFFCYIAIETTSTLWASSYISIKKGLPEEVGALGTTFLFVGITAGRFLCGFISDAVGDRKMMYLGQSLIVAGALSLFALSGRTAVLTSMTLLGLGCAPIFPCFIHYIPRVFGNANTGSTVSLLMGSSQVATLIMPILFGWIAEAGGMWLYPFFQLLLAVTMMVLLVCQKRVCGEHLVDAGGGLSATAPVNSAENQIK